MRSTSYGIPSRWSTRRTGRPSAGEAACDVWTADPCPWRTVAFAIGSYDDQSGDEVVTFRKRRRAARLVAVRRALLWAPLLLVSAGCGATRPRGLEHAPAERRAELPSQASCGRVAPMSRSRRSCARARRPTADRARALRPLRAAEREPLPDLLPRAGHGARLRLRAALVPRPAADQAERRHRLRPGAGSRDRPGAIADRRRPLGEARHALQRRQEVLELDGRDRLAGDADAHRPLLRQPAAIPRTSAARSARRDRRLGVLGRPDRAGRRAGRSRSTGPTRRGRSARPSPTAASASRTRCCGSCSTRRSAARRS